MSNSSNHKIIPTSRPQVSHHIQNWYLGGRLCTKTSKSVRSYKNIYSTLFIWLIQCSITYPKRVNKYYYGTKLRDHVWQDIKQYR